METVTSTYWIPDSNYEKFKHSIEKLNQKALRRGYPEFTLEVVNKEKRDVEIFIEDQVYEFKMLHYEVVVTGYLPRIEGGYELAGVLERVKERNLVYCTTGRFMERIDEMRSRPNYCDHCHSTRKRNRIYVLEDEQGQFIQVGNTCMSDYLQDKSADYLASYYETVKDIYESSRTKPEYSVDAVQVSTELVLQHVYHHVKEKGFQGASEKKPTYKDVMKTLFDQESKIHYDMNEINTAVQTIRAKDKTSEYLTNMVTLLTEDTVRIKDIRYLSSFLKAYSIILEHEEKERNRYQREAEHTNQIQKSTYQGNKGDKIVKKLKILSVIPYTSDMGQRMILRMEDSDENVYTWFTDYRTGFEKGELYLVSATIKDHKEYKELKQTILTRCKLEECGETEEEDTIVKFKNILLDLMHKSATGLELTKAEYKLTLDKGLLDITYIQGNNVKVDVRFIVNREGNTYYIYVNTYVNGVEVIDVQFDVGHKNALTDLHPIYLTEDNLVELLSRENIDRKAFKGKVSRTYRDKNIPQDDGSCLPLHTDLNNKRESVVNQRLRELKPQIDSREVTEFRL